jgi:hypothetical protein
MWFLTVTCLLTLMLLACIWTRMKLQRDSEPRQSLSGATDHDGLPIKNNSHKTRKKYRYSKHWGCY